MRKHSSYLATVNVMVVLENVRDECICSRLLWLFRIQYCSLREECLLEKKPPRSELRG